MPIKIAHLQIPRSIPQPHIFQKYLNLIRMPCMHGRCQLLASPALISTGACARYMCMRTWGAPTGVDSKSIVMIGSRPLAGDYPYTRDSSLCRMRIHTSRGGRRCERRFLGPRRRRSSRRTLRQAPPYATIHAIRDNPDFLRILDRNCGFLFNATSRGNVWSGRFASRATVQRLGALRKRPCQARCSKS